MFDLSGVVKNDAEFSRRQESMEKGHFKFSIYPYDH